MKTDYTALDAAIMEHIRSGSPVNPIRACRGNCDAPVGITISQIIYNRLVALRKAGKIQHRRGAGHGWIVVEEPHP